jgi:hypothetical protein
MSDDRGPGFAVNLSLFGDSTSGKARTQPKKPPKHFFPDCQPAALGQITASKAVQDAIANGRLPSCAIRQLSLDPLYHDITSSVPQRIEPKDAPRTEVPDRMRDGSDGPAPVSSDAKVKSSNPEYCEAISEPTLTPDASTDKKRDKKLRKQNVKATESCSPGKSPECLKAKGRDTIDISPTSIVIGEFVDALMTKKLTGLFKLRLPLSQKGAQRVAETLRIHVVRRNNKYELVGGYVSLKVILASDEIPTTIAAEIHNRVTKEDIAEWADTESRFIPLLFRLQQEQENTGRMADVDLPLDHDLFAVQRPRSKRTRRDEAFIEDLVNTIQSPAGRRLMHEPSNHEQWADTLRVSERTVTTRMREIKRNDY